MVHPLAAVVCLADALAKEFAPCFDPTIDVDEVALATATLGFRDRDLKAIRKEAERLLAPT